MTNETIRQGDIFIAGDTFYIVPVGTDLPEGDLEIRGLDGLTLMVSEESAKAHLATKPEVQIMVETTMDAMFQQFGELSNALSSLIPDAPKDPDPIRSMMLWAEQLGTMSQTKVDGEMSELEARAQQFAAENPDEEILHTMLGQLSGVLEEKMVGAFGPSLEENEDSSTGSEIE